MSTTCPGCHGPKTKRAELCGSCRKTANAIGVSVVTHVSTPATPTVPRTQKQNAVYHGRLREMAQLQKPGLERGTRPRAQTRKGPKGARQMQPVLPRYTQGPVQPPTRRRRVVRPLTPAPKSTKHRWTTGLDGRTVLDRSLADRMAGGQVPTP